MSNLTLREYHKYIDNLLEKNDNTEAIFHCTNILTSFPKSIKTYQQLGQALLENKRFSDAAEVFSKVLTVYPDDFMAHAGLSAIHEDNRELDKAIWHMERAFETQPSNPAIQDEFRRLLSRRDGSAPSKIRFTRGALIRLYLKSDLSQQGIAEAQSALQADPDRVDLKLLLASMLFQNDAKAEAAELCNEILSINPYCFDANRIMFEISSSLSDQEEYNPVFLQRLVELEPYYSFIETATEDVDAIPADKIMLTKPEFINDETGYSPSSEWAERIEIPWHDDAEDILSTEPMSGQINENLNDNLTAKPSTPIPFFEEDTEIEKLATSDKPDADEGTGGDLPEWIAKAGWIRANVEESSPDLVEPIDESQIAENEPSAEPADTLPDWLKSLHPEGSDSPQLFSATDDELIPEANIPPLPPEMLAELLSDETADIGVFPLSHTPSENLKPEATDATIKDLSTDLPETTNFEPIPDLPDWLKDLDTSDVKIPELELDVSSPEVVRVEESEEPITADGQISDFITEMETSDLIGELEPLPADVVEGEETITSTFENEVEILSDLGSDETIAEEIPQIEKPEEQVKEEAHARTTIPSWVKNILSGSEESKPIISPHADVTVESGNQGLSRIEDEEELITDLPDQPNAEGAISQEVTSELEYWLQEMESTETAPTTVNVSIESPTQQDESEISLENLVDSSEMENDQVVASEITEELPSEEFTYDDRLSSMIDEKEISTAIPAIEDIATETVAALEKTDVEKLIDLLHQRDYASFTDVISKQPLPVDTANQVIEELQETLKKDPHVPELWQDLGDLQSKDAKFNDALNSYRKAEENILF